MADYALIRNNTIVNVIVVNDSGSDATNIRARYQAAIGEITLLSSLAVAGQLPGIGWSRLNKALPFSRPAGGDQGQNQNQNG